MGEDHISVHAIRDYDLRWVRISWSVEERVFLSRSSVLVFYVIHGSGAHACYGLKVTQTIFVVIINFLVELVLMMRRKRSLYSRIRAADSLL